MTFLAGRFIHICDVAPRDGLQMEPHPIPTDSKVALIDALSGSGLAKIEAVSFVSPRRVPSMADAEAVMSRIARPPGVSFVALVPNVRGARRALDCAVDELNVVVSASDAHNRANVGMSVQESLQGLRDIADDVSGKVPINVSLSTAFGCPFEGHVPVARLLELIAAVRSAGIERVSLCDTTGIANPEQVAAVSRAVLEMCPNLRVTLHFHDTRAMALANTVAGIWAGVDRFDSSLGGLGGCPFAPGASGNVCSEDLVHMLHEMGFETGIDLKKLLEVSGSLPHVVGRGGCSAVARAGVASRRYPTPGSEGAGFVVPVRQRDANA